jgi:paraquat-inducible protein A
MPAPHLTCPLCVQEHAPVRLHWTQRARCVRCGAAIAAPGLLGRQAAPAFAVAGALLIVPAVLLPFATVSRIGPPRATVVFDGALALWQHGMPWMAGWVALCGTIVPALLLLALVATSWSTRRGAKPRSGGAGPTAVRVLQTWAMPEVQVLAVLVAFVRIEQLADVELGPGFWCYAAMSVALVIAWRTRVMAAPGEPQGEPA